MGRPEADRLTSLCRRLDRIATYGLPEPERTHELIDRARSFDALRPIRSAKALVCWKIRSTVWELGRRLLVDCRDDPSTLPAACRMLLVSISTGVLSAVAVNPSAKLLAGQSDGKLGVFIAAQGIVGLLVLWYVVALVRHPDHLPLRQVGAPSALIGVCLVVQAFTNQPLIESDHLYTVACAVLSVGSFGVALAALNVISDEWARWGLRANACGTALAGINVFDWVRRSYGVASVASAFQVAMICLGFTGTVMLARLPFRRDVPVAGPPYGIEPATE